MKLPVSRPSMEPLLGFLYPECCQICGEARAKAADGYVCAGCWREVRFIRPPYCARCGLPFLGAVTDKAECANCHDRELHFGSARAAVVAEGVALDVIHRFKYSRALWFEPFLADLLVREAKPALAGTGWDLVVPVPLHPVKEREREFNQAARIGRRLADALGIPMRAHLGAPAEPPPTPPPLARGGAGGGAGEGDRAVGRAWWGGPRRGVGGGGRGGAHDRGDGRCGREGVAQDGRRPGVRVERRPRRAHRAGVTGA